MNPWLKYIIESWEDAEFANFYTQDEQSPPLERFICFLKSLGFRLYYAMPRKYNINEDTYRILIEDVTWDGSYAEEVYYVNIRYFTGSDLPFYANFTVGLNLGTVMPPRHEIIFRKKYAPDEDKDYITDLKLFAIIIEKTLSIARQSRQEGNSKKLIKHINDMVNQITA